MYAYVSCERDGAWGETQTLNEINTHTNMCICIPICVYYMEVSAIKKKSSKDLEIMERKRFGEEAVLK